MNPFEMVSWGAERVYLSRCEIRHVALRQSDMSLLGRRALPVRTAGKSLQLFLLKALQRYNIYHSLCFVCNSLWCTKCFFTPTDKFVLFMSDILVSLPGNGSAPKKMKLVVKSGAAVDPESNREVRMSFAARRQGGLGSRRYTVRLRLLASKIFGLRPFQNFRFRYLSITWMKFGCQVLIMAKKRAKLILIISSLLLSLDTSVKALNQSIYLKNIYL